MTRFFKLVLNSLFFCQCFFLLGGYSMALPMNPNIKKKWSYFVARMGNSKFSFHELRVSHSFYTHFCRFKLSVSHVPNGAGICCNQLARCVSSFNVRPQLPLERAARRPYEGTFLRGNSSNTDIMVGQFHPYTLGVHLWSPDHSLLADQLVSCVLPVVHEHVLSVSR